MNDYVLNSISELDNSISKSDIFLEDILNEKYIDLRIVIFENKLDVNLIYKLNNVYIKYIKSDDLIKTMDELLYNINDVRNNMDKLNDKIKSLYYDILNSKYYNSLKNVKNEISNYYSKLNN